MSRFQMIIIGLFVLFIFVGVFVFAFYKGNSSKQIPSVVIWGTLDLNDMQSVLSKVGSKQANILYVQKSASTFDSALTNALALGTGPDAIIAPQDILFKEQSKITLIPYANIPQSQYLANYIPEAGLFLEQNGLLALPFSVDPMVMYWNKDIFSNAGYATPPQYWDQFNTLTPVLTIKDKAFNVTQSAVGLGTFSNIDHAKEILSMLMIQSGSPIVSDNAGIEEGALGITTPDGSSPTASALTFFTQFANPSSAVYTWNSSLLDSQSLFVANRLAVYLGFASEASILAQKNPNLNFGMAIVPQVRPATGKSVNRTTFGELYGMAISRGSHDPVGTLLALQLISAPSILSAWSSAANLPPVVVSSLSINPTDPNSGTLINSALWARGWLDPDGVSTNQIFSAMVGNVISGRESVPQALTEAGSQLQNLLPQ